MGIESFVIQFGYPALMLGVLLEGETVLVVAAFLAHRGYLNLGLVILIGFIFTFMSDEFFFWIGRTRGNKFLEQRPGWKPNVDKAKSLLARQSTLIFLGFRFMYGLRAVMPFVIGMSGFSPKRFAILNFVGALLWTSLFGMAGYLFGHTMEVIFKDISKYEIWIILGIILIAGFIIWLQRHTLFKKKDATSG
jgi:membrane protein DedA with SNARE-associated domain